MQVVRLSADTLAAHATGDFSPIERALIDTFVYHGWGRPGSSEIASWRHSIPQLASVLTDAGLGGVEVMLEHRLPLTSKRADVVLAGLHPRTGDPSYVVVELKQWSRAHRHEDTDTLVEVEGVAYNPTLHPAWQVGEYVRYYRDFLKALAGHPEEMAGVAYLHNADDAGVADLWTMPPSDDGRMFTGQRRGEFVSFLQSRLAPSPGAGAADVFLASAIGPSKQLLKVAAAEIRDREQFVLLDEQRVAYELVMRAVDDARRADSKEVIIVAGGPGSGKSVIALSLLGELARQGRTVLHATGSKSFTQTLRTVAGKGSTRTKNLFTYFNSFIGAERNGLDVLVLDEAHRIREQSVNRFTRAELRAKAQPQVNELLDAARVPVFLLDEHQVVRPGEIGTVADIRAAAAARSVNVRQVDLNAQYRSGGSAAYVTWVLRLLGLEPGGPIPWQDEDAFAVELVDSPEDLEVRLAEKRAEGYSARMTAGFCWPWSDPAGSALVPDVRIGEWARPWNTKADRRVGPYPPSSLWATEDGGETQVGCVYTAQGFEYDWNGLIIGPDLVVRDGEWISRREFSKDPAFRSRRTVSDEAFDGNVRNVYKVLLTRGMVGTVLYSTDAETREYLRSLLAGSEAR
ncbi:DUF2075 domain-containing protein [Demequina sp. SYSU T00192]|uniref:DUF2075 domain-containing protein n=1 Tax=Demequina litoralis TaxID=3051660 RepID=A0ABT8G9I9_9MICO|nr:DUF2075 domain-containing protein [Demequina sp. SYSU T00192]MDN4475801.1 DUF2075 domain-containing protein [Demequina sp. SYSU T00192]